MYFLKRTEPLFQKTQYTCKNLDDSTSMMNIKE